MKRIVSFFSIFIMLWVSSSFADSLVIKFKSGRTQEVTLKDSVNAIEGMYFKSGSEKAPSSSNSSKEISEPSKSTIQQEEAQGETKKEEGKPKIRIKWAQPKWGE